MYKYLMIIGLVMAVFSTAPQASAESVDAYCQKVGENSQDCQNARHCPSCPRKMPLSLDLGDDQQGSQQSDNQDNWDTNNNSQNDDSYNQDDGGYSQEEEVFYEDENCPNGLRNARTEQCDDS